MQSDCYALGMVIYEVLSGRTPFAPSTAPVVVRIVLEGKRPGRPQGEEGKLFTDAIWGVLELCWKPRPSDRTSVKAVLLGLGGDPSPSGPNRPFVDGDLEMDGGGWSDIDITAKNSRMCSLFDTRLAFHYPCGTQDRRLRVVTTDSWPHRHGAARKGHRSLGWRAGPGERSDLSLECSAYVDKPDEFYCVRLSPCAARGPFSQYISQRVISLVGGFGIEYQRAVNIMVVAHTSIEQGNHRIVRAAYQEVPSTDRADTKTPALPPTSLCASESIHATRMSLPFDVT